MTRYEQLQRLSADERTEARHIALFHAITESWVNDGIKQRWEIDHKNLMNLSRLKGSTYRKTLRELAEWKHIDYTPTSNRHVKTAINFPVTAPESDKVNQVTAPEFSEVRYCNPVTAPVFTTVTRFTAPESSGVNRVTTPECNTVTLFTAPESDKVSLVYRARIQRGNVICSHPDTILANDSSEFGFASHDKIIHLTNRLIISKKVDSKVIGKEKRVKGKKPKTGENEALPVGCKFIDSPLFDLAIFISAFGDDERYRGVDLDYYRERVLNWRDKTGAEPVRLDWVATTRTFMLNDFRESKLKMIETTKTLANETRNNTLKRSGQPIIPATNEKRSFGSW